MTEGGYQARYYPGDLPREFFSLGLVSLTLTLINILCIIITGVLILRLKEVTSTKVPQKFQDFWSTDIKAHRDYYKAFRKEEGAERQPISTLQFEDLSCDDDQGDFYLKKFERYKSVVSLFTNLYVLLFYRRITVYLVC